MSGSTILRPLTAGASWFPRAQLAKCANVCAKLRKIAANIVQIGATMATAITSSVEEWEVVSAKTDRLSAVSGSFYGSAAAVMNNKKL